MTNNGPEGTLPDPASPNFDDVEGLEQARQALVEGRRGTESGAGDVPAERDPEADRRYKDGLAAARVSLAKGAPLEYTVTEVDPSVQVSREIGETHLPAARQALQDALKRDAQED